MVKRSSPSPLIYFELPLVGISGTRNGMHARRANWIGLQSEDERSAARRFHVNHAGRDQSVLRKQPPHREMRRRCIKSVPRRGLARKTKTRRGITAWTRHRGAAHAKPGQTACLFEP